MKKEAERQTRRQRPSGREGVEAEMEAERAEDGGAAGLCVHWSHTILAFRNRRLLATHR